jgi:hypothetical protein
MSDILGNNINELGERISLLDTAAMFRFTPLKLSLCRSSALGPGRDQPLMPKAMQKGTAKQARQKRESSAKKARKSRLSD